MTITGIVLAFPAGIITGILGGRAGMPPYVNALVGACAGIAFMKLCIFFGLP